MVEWEYSSGGRYEKSVNPEGNNRIGVFTNYLNFEKCVHKENVHYKYEKFDIQLCQKLNVHFL